MKKNARDENEHYITIITFIILYNLIYNLYDDRWIIDKNKTYKKYLLARQFNQILLIISLIFTLFILLSTLKIIKKYIIKLIMLLIPVFWCFASSGIFYDEALIERISIIIYYFVGKSVNIILLLGIIQMLWYLNKRYSPIIKYYLYLLLSKKNHKKNIIINYNYLFGDKLFSNKKFPIISIIQINTDVSIIKPLNIFIDTISVFISLVLFYYIINKYFKEIKMCILFLKNIINKYIYKFIKYYILFIISLLKK